MPRDSDDSTVEAFSLLGQPGHLIRRCQQRAVDLFVEEVGPDGPTPRQFAILLSVHQNPGINQTDLVRFSGIDRSTLTEMLRRMIARGLVRRERSGDDRRVNALRVTEAGAAMLRRAMPAMARAQARIVEPIAPERRADVLDALRILAGIAEA